jgi:transposase
MSLHLAAISARVTPGRHCVLLLDQAGWHLSDHLVVPANISILPFPPKCPELNPVENVWQFLRDNWLSNRVFASYEAIVDHCCEAWNKLDGSIYRRECAGSKVDGNGNAAREIDGSRFELVRSTGMPRPWHCA